MPKNKPKKKEDNLYVGRVVFSEKLTATSYEDALKGFREYLNTYGGDIIEDNLEIIKLK